MANRLNYLVPSRLPTLPHGSKDPKQVEDYRKALNLALQEWYRMDRRAIRELDYHPTLSVARITSGQSLTANTLTTVQFNSAIVDTHSWWDSSAHTYTPKEPGFYRCSWAIDFHDTAAFAASTYGYAQLNVGSGTPYRFLAYGNGTGLDIMTEGSAVVECDGSATALSISALILTGTAPTIYEEASSYRSWFSVDYIGRRFVAT